MMDLLPLLSLVLEIHATHQLAETLLDTYLGHEAGRRVLNGSVKRGEGRPIAAALWYCDLSGFTQLAERLPATEIIEMLDGLHAWIVKASGDSCEDCKKSKSPDGKLPPPHMLAFRLNAMSKQVAAWLVGSPTGWRAPYFTSDYARKYKEVEEAYMAHMAAKH